MVQNNPYGLKPRKGGNVMTIVKAKGGDLVQSDGKTAQKACELIRKHKNDPFFLTVGFVRPHVPFVAPKNYFKPYPYKQMILPPKVENDWNDIPEAGINDVTSVNGKMLEEQQFWMKVSLHEESALVTLIIKVPGKEPAVCNSFVELLDLYPTVAELAGFKPLSGLQGKSLVKTLDDSEYQVRDMAFSISRWNGELFYLIRTNKWAYIQYGENGKGGMELYNMQYDP